MSIATNQIFNRLPSAQEYNNGRTNSILSRPLQPQYQQVIPNSKDNNSLLQQQFVPQFGNKMPAMNQRNQTPIQIQPVQKFFNPALTQSQRINSKFNYATDTFDSPLSKQMWPGLAQKVQNLQSVYAPGQVNRVPILRAQNYQIPIQLQLNDSNQSGRRPQLYNQQSQKIHQQNQMNYMINHSQQNHQHPQHNQQIPALNTQQQSYQNHQHLQHNQQIPALNTQQHSQQNHQHPQHNQQIPALNTQQHSQPPQQNQQHPQHNQLNNYNQANTSQPFKPNNYYNMRLRNISKPQSPQQGKQVLNQLPKLDKKQMEEYQSKKQFQVPVEKREQNLDQKQSYLTYELRVGDGVIEMDNLSRIQDPDSSQFMQQIDEPLCNIIIVEQMVETEVPMSLEKLPQELLVSDIIQIALKISSKRLKRPMAWVQLGKATKQQMSSLMSVKELRETYSPPIQMIIEDLNVR